MLALLASRAKGREVGSLRAAGPCSRRRASAPARPRVPRVYPVAFSALVSVKRCEICHKPLAVRSSAVFRAPRPFFLVKSSLPLC